MAGFRAQVVRIPDETLAVAVLCNREDLNPRGLAYGVADLYLEDRLGPAPETDPRRRPRSGTGPPTTSVSADPVTPVDLADYVGDFYSDELDVTYHLAVDGSALGVRIGRWPRLALELTGSDTVVGTSFPAWTGPRRVELIFTRDARATVTGFALSAGQARDIRFIRLRR